MDRGASAGWFLEFARISSTYLTNTRARHDLPNLQLEIGDAGHLSCANGAFAASLSRLVLTFVTNPEQVAAEMVCVTRPGGVVAAAVWDFCGGLIYQRILWGTAAVLDPQAGSHSRSTVFESAQHARRLEGTLANGRPHKYRSRITGNPHELRQFRRQLGSPYLAGKVRSATFKSFDAMAGQLFIVAK